MASVAQTILAIERKMARDFNAGKMEELLAHFDPKVIGFSSTQHERVAGQRAMQKTFQYYLHATSRIRYTIDRPQVHVFKDTVVATFYWTVELGRGRPRHVIKGRGSHVFVQKGGKWVVAHEHFSRAH